MICYVMSAFLWLVYLWLDSMVVCYAFEPREEGIGRGILTLGLMAAQLPAAVVKFLYNENPFFRYGALVAVGVITVAYAAIFLKGAFWQKMVFMMCEYLLALSAEMICIGLLGKYLDQSPELSYNSPVMVLMLVFVCTVTAVMFQIFVVLWKKFIGRENQEISVIVTFSIFPISQILMIMTVNEQSFLEMSAYTGMILLAAAVGTVADGMLLYTLLRQQQMQELKLRLGQMQGTWEIARNHYHEIEARREEFARIRHDMRNQQLVLQELLHQGEYEKAEMMLGTLTEAVAATSEYVYCGDPVFNAIMGETERACREKGVEMKYDLEIPDKLKLDPVVICSILSNMTRNAVAAAAETTGEREPFLSVKAAVKGDYLHICVENSRKNGIPKKRTRKGYGLEILKDMVERNHGQMDVEPGEGKFRVNITVENF